MSFAPPAATGFWARSGPLIVFDFDGVLMDGMPEYWWSARAAALQLAPELALPEQAPAGFARLRPLIHKGWEMVLMAAEYAGHWKVFPSPCSTAAAYRCQISSFPTACRVRMATVANPADRSLTIIISLRS